MKIFQTISMSRATLWAIPLFFLSLLVFNACGDDDHVQEVAYFHIEGDPANLRVGIAGGESKEYAISSNRPWKIVAKSEGDWARVSPAEGINDGTFKFIVDETPGFEPRTMNFAFVVDGEEQPTLFRIDQRANLAELIIDYSDLQIPVGGGELAIGVISNVEWNYQVDASWATHRKEGDKIWVSAPANTGPGELSLNVSIFTTGHPELEEVLTVTQPEAYLTLEDAGDTMQIPEDGGEISIVVATNVEWDYTVVGGSWATHQRVDDKIVIAAPKNMHTEELSLTVSISAPGYPALEEEVMVTQLSGAIIFREDFNWLAYGSATPYTTTGERRFDQWTAEEKAHGWYSMPVPNANNEQLCYARQGFVKLGKTGFGGDLISPKLEKIEGTADVRVTFKAAGYISAGNGTTTEGNKDDNLLKIIVLGAGTPSVESLVIDNFPNGLKADNEGVVNDIWAADRAYSFTITGATAETQIKFLGRDYVVVPVDGWTKNVNRIFLDDIQVELIFD